MKILDLLFPREDIGPGDYMKRWVVYRFKSGRCCYIQRFGHGDDARHMHDHPKDFLSIGLCGWYNERVCTAISDSGNSVPVAWLTRKWKAPWIRRFKAEHIHSLPHIFCPTWTILFGGRNRRKWGFYTEEGWVHWREYAG